MEQLAHDYKEDNLLAKGTGNRVNAVDHPEIIRFNKFVKWLKDGGAIFDKIKMRYYSPDYRGVHARGKIRKNEVFLMIPKELIITLEMAKATPIGSKMEKAHLNLLSPKHSFLSTYVLQEKRKPETRFEPYFDILPKSTNNFPIFFTAEEKKWLEGSPFLSIF
jgi:histone-lysine N-methyltransferase SETD3